MFKYLIPKSSTRKHTWNQRSSISLSGHKSRTQQTLWWKQIRDDYLQSYQMVSIANEIWEKRFTQAWPDNHLIPIYHSVINIALWKISFKQYICYFIFNSDNSERAITYQIRTILYGTMHFHKPSFPYCDFERFLTTFKRKDTPLFKKYTLFWFSFLTIWVIAQSVSLSLLLYKTLSIPNRDAGTRQYSYVKSELDIWGSCSRLSHFDVLPLVYTKMKTMKV